MFLNIFGPIIMVLRLPVEEEMGAPEEKRKTLKWAPRISSLLRHKILFFPLLFIKIYILLYIHIYIYIAFSSPILDSPVKAVKI